VNLTDSDCMALGAVAVALDNRTGKRERLAAHNIATELGSLICAELSLDVAGQARALKEIALLAIASLSAQPVKHGDRADGSICLQRAAWIPADRNPTEDEANAYGDVEWSDSQDIWQAKRTNPKDAKFWRPIVPSQP